jgi:hypothetical protein
MVMGAGDRHKYRPEVQVGDVATIGCTGVAVWQPVLVVASTRCYWKYW